MDQISSQLSGIYISIFEGEGSNFPHSSNVHHLQRSPASLSQCATDLSIYIGLSGGGLDVPVTRKPCCGTVNSLLVATEQLKIEKGNERAKRRSWPPSMDTGRDTELIGSDYINKSFCVRDKCYKEEQRGCSRRQSYMKRRCIS